MAKKPAPKKSVKKASKPVAKKPVAKKASKPAAKKVNKPVAKKVVAKKSVAKKAAKPVAKKVATKKPVAKKPVAKKVVVKKIAKPVVKKVAPKKVEKKISKPVAKPTPKKVEKAMSKKEEKLLLKKQLAQKKAAEEVIPELKIREIKKVGTQPLKRSTLDITRSRYSDEELEEFKAIINEKLEKSKQELHYITEQITKSGENGTADTENRFGGMEDGAGTLEREYLNQMASRAGSFIEHLEKALMRIENKTYGICTVTGKLISKERLRAVPHATKSLEAKEMGKG